MSQRSLLHHELLRSNEEASAGSSARPEGELAGVPHVVFLHGVFGAGRNWRTIARRLVHETPGWGALLVDLRLHGDSQGFDPPHTISACAEDLDRLARALELRIEAVVAHSLGGKIGLRFLELPALPPSRCWVIDSSPSAGRAGGSAQDMLRAVRDLPARFPDRASAVEGLISKGIDEPVARWMATNLVSSDGALRWRLDVDAIEELLADFYSLDLWGVVETPPEGVRLRFAKAKGSDVLSAADCDRIARASERGPVELHHVEGGHWVNADNPDALVALLTRDLRA